MTQTLGVLGDEFPLGGAPRILSCGACGFGNPRDARFCAECGQRLHHVLAPTTGSMLRAGVPYIADSGAGVHACTRCAGANGVGARRCQFCDALLVVADLAEHAGVSADAHRGSGENSGPPEETLQVPRLVVISQDGSAGREFPLTDDQTDIGRLEGEVILSDDPYVSPRHARLIRRDGQLFVRDLGSVNGVYVRLRKAHRLVDADLLLLGVQVLRFETVNEGSTGLGPAEEQGTKVFGSPSSPRYARLAQRTVEGVTRDVFHLTRNQVVLGREHGDVVFSGDAFMSRRHAVIARDPDTRQFMLRDLGSSNGTYVAIRREHELREGDHVRIGQHLFRLDIDRRTRPI